ncbi:MAG: hypothetical protein OXH22_13465 [Chloroflexi bacterium]|nr:hypothetical protein [Chloroflexota bacterium]
MPTESTLLAYLTPRLTSSVEDMAVEALGYILSKSESSRGVLNRVLQSGAPGLNAIKLVRTQVTGETGARPDLVGFDEQGKERVLIEAKFWAGLTENQPNGYLERLPKDGGPSVLLFVAPEARRDTLWTELQRRVNVEVGESSEENGLRGALVIGSQRYLMLTNWRSLLGQMANQTSEAGESSAQIDIRQLQGLTEHMDEDAFLPIRPTELAPEFPRRMLNLRHLVDAATDKARADGFVSTSGLMVTPWVTGYGRWIKLGGTNVWFGINFELWVLEDSTPIWLDFRTARNCQIKPAEARRRLNLTDDKAFIPIHLPTGVEYDTVLDAVVRKLKSIEQRINPDYEF